MPVEIRLVPGNEPGATLAPLRQSQADLNRKCVLEKKINFRIKFFKWLMFLDNFFILYC